MANVHGDTAGAEHPGFLQKIKDKLHIGHQQKDKEVDPATNPETTDAAVASKSTSTAVDAPAASPPVKEEPTVAKPSPPVEHESRPPALDLNKLVGHESEHHGGTPTFLVALPDKDIPDEVTKETATSDAQGGEFFDSEEVFSKAKEGEHHEGVPTFLVAIPDQDLPDEGTKEHLHHVTAGQASDGAQQSPDKEFDSEEVFNKAQQGEHHEGVPTFLVALPDQDLPGDETKEKLHHVSAGRTEDA